jgi:hypothetical protein
MSVNRCARPVREGLPLPVTLTLIRAFRTEDGRRHGEWRGRRGADRELTMPFFPGRGDSEITSPYAGQHLLLTIGESPNPPGWTLFLLPVGVFYATSVVCWLLFGADEPDAWPPPA